METEEPKKDSELIDSARELSKYAISKTQSSFVIHCVNKAIAKALHDRWAEVLEQSVLCSTGGVSIKELVKTIENSMDQQEPRKLTSKELKKQLKHCRNYLQKKALEKQLNETLREEKKKERSKNDRKNKHSRTRHRTYN